MEPEDPEQMSARQIIAEITRSRTQQDKRRALLRDSARLSEHASEAGMSISDMRKLLSNNFEQNSPTLAKLIEYANSPRFAERQRQEQASALKIKWHNVKEVSPGFRRPK
jgi:DNA-binding transcriptional MerR regulator